MKVRGRVLSIGFIMTFFLVSLACSLPGVATPSAVAPTADLGLENTRIAMGVEQTLIASEKTRMADEEAQVEANQSDEQEQPTQTPYPTYTYEPDEPTFTPEPTEMDIDALIEGANVLVFEDVKGYFDLTPWVSRAVDNMNFSGGKVVEVADAVGTFMTHLNSPTKWDLIIVAAEVRTGVRGEFWDIIADQVDNNVALVAEVWYLDDIANGRIAPLLGECGIKYQRDWFREDDYEVLNYSLYWLDQNHDLFSHPNVVGPLYTPSIYWVGDAGDQIAIGSGGDAQLLAGLYPNEKSNFGVLAACEEGRVIFQTFSTHDYKQSQMIPLWENYIYYTLKNHFETQGE